MINLHRVSFGYQSGKLVLTDVDLSISLTQGIVGLIGENGSGKSTLLKIISRILKPKEGIVTIQGKEYGKYTSTEFSRLVGFLGTNHAFELQIPVFELVKLGRYSYLPWISPLSPEDLKTIYWAIDKVDLGDYIHRNYHELSSGEKQRARLAMVLAQNTRIILLDEPTTFLDPRHWVKTIGVLREIAREKLLVIATHDLNFLKITADYLFSLKEGKIIYAGEASNFWNSKHFFEVFGIETDKFKSSFV